MVQTFKNIQMKTLDLIANTANEKAIGWFAKKYYRMEFGPKNFVKINYCRSQVRQNAKKFKFKSNIVRIEF